MKTQSRLGCASEEAQEDEAVGGTTRLLPDRHRQRLSARDGSDLNIPIARSDPFEEAPEPGPLRAGGSTVRHGGVAQAVRQLRHRLAALDGIINLTGARPFSPDIQRHHGAKGFLVRVPGTGRLFALKPAALREWVAGSLPLRPVLAALEYRGWLIRGCDGKTTRQVVIPGLGRHRYYCFKLLAAAHRTLIDAEVGIAPSRNPRIEGDGYRTQPERRQPTWTDETDN
jgi:hypothetical protein